MSELLLQDLDADLRDYYRADFGGRYVACEPQLIQIIRLLRGLTQQAPNGEDGAKQSEGTQDDVQPQELEAQTAGGAFMTVDGLAQLPGQGGKQSAFDLLVQIAARLGVLAERLGDLCGTHVGVTAAAGIAHADHAMLMTPRCRLALANARKRAVVMKSEVLCIEHLLAACVSVLVLQPEGES